MSQMSQHGTAARYSLGKCRCERCTAANTEYSAKVRSGAFARRSDLAEFMRGLGWDRGIPSPIPQVFIDRWNRDHPDRPYIGGGAA